MKSEEFIKLAELFGFAPSRSLRELLEAVERMEREACARVCEKRADGECYVEGSAEADGCAAAIRARSEK